MLNNFFITAYMVKMFMSVYNRNNFFSATAFVIPFGIFFPLQNTNSFFGQWGNLFIWFAIGFALSQTNVTLKEDQNKNTNDIKI